MVLGMLAFAAFASALLLSHQPPQIETDRAAGKQSFAVRHGAALTRKVALYLQVLTLLSLLFAPPALSLTKSPLVAPRAPLPQPPPPPPPF